MSAHYRVIDDFYDDADRLRSEFTAVMGETLRAPPEQHPERFVWDYWHAPPRYTYVRTSAAAFFSAEAFSRFYQTLCRWTRRELGLTGRRAPWLSFYVSGCRQGWHHDVGNGEWAFVYSLSPRSPQFTGGETLIAERMGVPCDWERAPAAQVARIAPAYNRLVLFDSRIPHAVSDVSGTLDPLEARLVIHGWLDATGVIADGDFAAPDVRARLGDALQELAGELDAPGSPSGMLVLRASASNGVLELSEVANTLFGEAGPPDAARALAERIRRKLHEVLGGRRWERGSLVIPLVLTENAR